MTSWCVRPVQQLFCGKTCQGIASGVASPLVETTNRWRLVMNFDAGRRRSLAWSRVRDRLQPVQVYLGQVAGLLDNRRDERRLTYSVMLLIQFRSRPRAAMHQLCI